jgi:hypothetical protein
VYGKENLNIGSNIEDILQHKLSVLNKIVPTSTRQKFARLAYLHYTLRLRAIHKYFDKLYNLKRKGNVVLRNVGKHLPNDMLYKPRRQESLPTPLREN